MKLFGHCLDHIGGGVEKRTLPAVREQTLNLLVDLASAHPLVMSLSPIELSKPMDE
jgi:hypothetical protein